MNPVWKTAGTSMNRLALWFMPVTTGRDKYDDYAYHLLVSIGLVTAAFSLLYVTVSFIIGFRIGVMLMLACFFMLLSILAAFRFTGSFRPCANLYLACCFFVAILGCSFYSGGIHSMVLPWFALVPITSVLLLAFSADSLFWTFLACAAVFSYGLAGMLGFQFPMRYDTRYTEFFNLICIVGLVMILSLIAFIFGYNRKQAMATISEQNSSLEKALAEIEKLAFYDHLTHLPNRRLLLERLGHALAASTRSERYGALVFLDLDQFKLFNDTHGHEAGDMLLVEVAKRLADCVQGVDTVARFGGDEFAVLLNPLDVDLDISQERASGIAEEIAAVLTEPYVLRLQKGKSTATTLGHKCSFRVGVVPFLKYEGTQEEFLDWVDKAIYQAKLAGKGAIQLYMDFSGSPAVNNSVA